MNCEYIYESNLNKTFTNLNQAILVLPDIYGQSDYAKATVEELAKTFNTPTYLLDYFYELTNKPNNIAQDNQELARELMNKMSGELFVKFFSKATSEISKIQPDLQTITVVGFCFAGRLAFITGSDKRVVKIVSFYGAGANLENYIENNTAIEYLVANRAGDSGLRVLGFFGNQDESIPKTDREKTKASLVKAGIDYKAYEFDCGHAYFQTGRANYNEAAANESWEILKKFLINNQ